MFQNLQQKFKLIYKTRKLYKKENKMKTTEK